VFCVGLTLSVVPVSKPCFGASVSALPAVIRLLPYLTPNIRRRIGRRRIDCQYLRGDTSARRRFLQAESVIVKATVKKRGKNKSLS
jgi:hypothetical protein